MKHRTISKLIISQTSIIAFLDSKASSARKDPFIAFPETDAAVTFCDRSEFWNLDAEFEGAAVAVAFVGFELCGGVLSCH
jgi:hypothetical protein